MTYTPKQTQWDISTGKPDVRKPAIAPYTMTFQVWDKKNNKELARHHLRINPQSYSMVSQALLAMVVTADGIYAERQGFLKKTVVMSGHTGVQPEVIADRWMDGQSAFVELDSLLCTCAGEDAKTNDITGLKEASFILSDGTTENVINLGDIELRWYNWDAPKAKDAGTGSAEVANVGYYVIVSPPSNVITLERSVAQTNFYNYRLQFDCIEKYFLADDKAKDMLKDAKNEWPSVVDRLAEAGAWDYLDWLTTNYYFLIADAQAEYNKLKLAAQRALEADYSIFAVPIATFRTIAEDVWFNGILLGANW